MKKQQFKNKALQTNSRSTTNQQINNKPTAKKTTKRHCLDKNSGETNNDIRHHVFKKAEP